MEFQAVEVYFGHDGAGHRVVSYNDPSGLVDWQKRMLTMDELERIRSVSSDKVESLLSNYIGPCPSKESFDRK